MEPPDSSFADEFNVPQEGAVLVFDVRRAAVLLPFHVIVLRCLKKPAWPPSRVRVFEFADKVRKEAQYGSLAHLSKVFPSHLHSLSKVAAVGFCA